MFTKEYSKSKTIEELWTYEKKIFKPLFITFMVVLLVLGLLPLAQTLWILLDVKIWEILAEKQKLLGSTNSSTNTDIRGIIATSSVVYLLLFIGHVVYGVLFGISLKKVYLNKSPLFISKSAIHFVSIITFLIFFRLFIAIINISRNGIHAVPEYTSLGLALLPGIYGLLMIAFNFLVSREVKLIVFIAEQIKKMQEFKKMSEKFANSGMNPLDFLLKNIAEQNDKESQKDSEDEFKFEDKMEDPIYVETEEHEETHKLSDKEKADKRMQDYEKLMSLTNNQLYKLAEKLDIYGAEFMDKHKLVTLILNILEQKDSKNKGE